MQPISQEAKSYLQERMPQFIRSVKRAKVEREHRRRATSLRITLAAFNEDVLLLHAALWYAGSYGITVCVQPSGGEETPAE